MSYAAVVPWTTKGEAPKSDVEINSINVNIFINKNDERGIWTLDFRIMIPLFYHWTISSNVKPGEKGLEPLTDDFEDRCSAIELSS